MMEQSRMMHRPKRDGDDASIEEVKEETVVAREVPPASCLKQGVEYVKGKRKRSMISHKKTIDENDGSNAEVKEETAVLQSASLVKIDGNIAKVATTVRINQEFFEAKQAQNRFGKSKGMFRIGTSGYIYKHWKGVIYPEKVPQKKWFEYYTHIFDTVEINNTFYRLPSHEVFESWHDQAPSGFCYALKFSRFGTHLKRLKDPEQAISLFIDRAARLGQDLTGPILVQLPPKFNVNVDRLKEFLQFAPKEYRWAIEFRDTRWFCDEVYDLLRAYNASLCIHDHEDIACIHPQVLTADWVYLRFHGKNYKHCYNNKQLEQHASWINIHLAAGLDVYAYFNNDYGGYAVSNAIRLRELVLGTK